MKPDDVYGVPGEIDEVGLRLVDGRMQWLGGKVDELLEAADVPGWSFLIVALEFQGAGMSYVTGAPTRREIIDLARRQGRRLALDEPPPGITFSREPGALRGGQIKALAEAARDSARLVRRSVPEGWGFALILYSQTSDHLVYISNGEREDMARLLCESADRWERHEDRPPGLLGKDH